MFGLYFIYNVVYKTNATNREEERSKNLGCTQSYPILLSGAVRADTGKHDGTDRKRQRKDGALVGCVFFSAATEH